MKTVLKRSDFPASTLEKLQNIYEIDNNKGLEDSLAYLRRTGHTIVSKDSPDKVADVLYRLRTTHSVSGDYQAFWIGQSFILVF